MDAKAKLERYETRWLELEEMKRSSGLSFQRKDQVIELELGGVCVAKGLLKSRFGKMYFKLTELC